MYIIAGLGNPEKKYDGTRHNAGFEAADRLSERLGIRLSDRKFNAVCGTGQIGGGKVLLLKPLTYMNRSGESLRAAADYYKVDPSHIIILYDDINFPCGRLRVRPQGSAGGHNGIKSIIGMLGTEGFPRIRIGVGGLSEHEDLISHVLGHFSKTDKPLMEEAYEAAAQAAELIVTEGCEAAMNRFNGWSATCTTP